MRSMLRGGAGAAGAFAVFSFTVGLALPLRANDLAQCGSYPNAEESHACLCPANVTSGSVWGTNPYTSDSNICRAALHAGVISPEGGPVYLERQDGLTSYPGSSANGVQTSSWGSYHTSFTFVKGPSAGAPCEDYPVGEATYTCNCDGSEDGWVWGSGPYAADSDICAAAIHAGIIDSKGGDITAIEVLGLDEYTGSERNGVTTSDWGSYGTSFVFDAN